MNNRRNRPKRNIPKSRSELVWDIIGFSFYISSVVFLLIIWDQLPNKVPGHYNALGEVDRWGAKTELLLLPGIGAFIIILMQVLEKFPETHNYPERFNESNAEQFYLHSRKLVNQLKNICLLLFSVILFESVSIALERGSGFGLWFLPLVIVGTGLPIVVGLVKQRKIQ